MKTKLSTLIATIVLGLSGATFTASAYAEEGKMVGPITKITMAADGKSATAILKDAKSGTPTTLTITDDLRVLSGSNVNLNLAGNTVNDAGLMTAADSGSAAYDAYVASVAAAWEATLANGTSSTNHDRVSVLGDFQHQTGAKTNVSFLGAYTPTVGDVFDLIDWMSLNLGGYTGTGALLSTGSTTAYGTGQLTAGGTLGDLQLPTLTGGNLWDVQLFQSHGIIFVVPEPSRCIFLAFGLGTLLLRRRRTV